MWVHPGWPGRGKHITGCSGIFQKVQTAGPTLGWHGVRLKHRQCSYNGRKHSTIGHQKSDFLSDVWAKNGCSKTPVSPEFWTSNLSFGLTEIYSRVLCLYLWVRYKMRISIMWAGEPVKQKRRICVCCPNKSQTFMSCPGLTQNCDLQTWIRNLQFNVSPQSTLGFLEPKFSSAQGAEIQESNAFRGQYKTHLCFLRFYYRFVGYLSYLNKNSKNSGPWAASGPLAKLFSICIHTKTGTMRTSKKTQTFCSKNTTLDC